LFSLVTNLLHSFFVWLRALEQKASEKVAILFEPSQKRLEMRIENDAVLALRQKETT
jgi:hypothetical protein